jgi:hypothetical protein
MGWWGVCVMEGDTPMDIEYSVRLALVPAAADINADSDDEADALEAAAHEAVVKVLKDNQYQHIIDRMQTGRDDDLCIWGDDDKNIGLQVLGEMVMCYGGSMEEPQRAIFREAATQDEWAQSDAERKQAMDEYIVRINNHVNGIATEPTSQGLFAKLDEMLAEGTPGLANR